MVASFLMNSLDENPKLASCYSSWLGCDMFTPVLIIYRPLKIFIKFTFGGESYGKVALGSLFALVFPSWNVQPKEHKHSFFPVCVSDAHT